MTEKFLHNQCSKFQVSSKGPYFGRAAWFPYLPNEKLPSAQEGYPREIERVTDVLDWWLQEHELLVGERFTYADLGFVLYTWFGYDVPLINQDGKSLEKSPA